MAERAEIKSTARALQAVFNVHDTQPIVAYAALINVLGALIGTVFADERQEMVDRAVAHLPFYVEAYRVKEKKL